MRPVQSRPSHAFGGGTHGFFGSPGVDPAWLDGSPLMGGLVMLWIVVQLAIIGSVSPLQPISFVAGAAIATLAAVLLRADRRRARVGATA